MNDLRHKVAYLQGLAAGLELDDVSKEGKVLTEILTVLQDLTETVQAVQENQDELEQYLLEIDEDLSILEENRLDEDPEVAETRCPDCGQTLNVEAGEVGGGPIDLICPNCGSVSYGTNEETGPENQSFRTT